MSPVLSFFLFFFKFPFYDCFCFLFLVLISFVCIAFAPNLGGFFALYILFSVLRHDIFSVFHLFVVFRWPWDLSFACFWDLLWFFPCYHVSLPNLQRSIRQTALWKQTPIRVRCALGVICWMVFRYVSFFLVFSVSLSQGRWMASSQAFYDGLMSFESTSTGWCNVFCFLCLLHPGWFSFPISVLEDPWVVWSRFYVR